MMLHQPYSQPPSPPQLPPFTGLAARFQEGARCRGRLQYHLTHQWNEPWLAEGGAAARSVPTRGGDWLGEWHSRPAPTPWS